MADFLLSYGCLFNTSGVADNSRRQFILLPKSVVAARRAREPGKDMEGKKTLLLFYSLFKIRIWKAQESLFPLFLELPRQGFPCSVYTGRVAPSGSDRSRCLWGERRAAPRVLLGSLYCFDIQAGKLLQGGLWHSNICFGVWLHV